MPGRLSAEYWLGHTCMETIEVRARATGKKQPEGPPELTWGRTKVVSPKPQRKSSYTELLQSLASDVRANRPRMPGKEGKLQKDPGPQRSPTVRIRNLLGVKATQKKEKQNHSTQLLLTPNPKAAGVKKPGPSGEETSALKC